MDRWLKLSDAARLAQTSAWKLRERVEMLDTRLGGGIIRRTTGGHIRVNVDALERAEQLEVERLDETLGNVLSRLETLERRLDRFQTATNRELRKRRSDV